MITEILEKYLDELTKKYENGANYIYSDTFESLSNEKKVKIKTKFKDLKTELNNTAKIIKALKESTFKESNYKINFELNLKK